MRKCHRQSSVRRPTNPLQFSKHLMERTKRHQYYTLLRKRLLCLCAWFYVFWHLPCRRRAIHSDFLPRRLYNHLRGNFRRRALMIHWTNNLASDLKTNIPFLHVKSPPSLTERWWWERLSPDIVEISWFGRTSLHASCILNTSTVAVEDEETTCV